MLFTEPVWAIMYAFSLVEFGLSEKRISSKLENENDDISWMIVDMLHYLTLLRI